MSNQYGFSSFPQNEMAKPEFPARPVRPIRWTYVSEIFGIPPKDVDVFLVAPKGSGASLRSLFLKGQGLNSSYAVFQDATGKAQERALALGIAIGSG